MQDLARPVAVCVCTYRRPEGLARLLTALASLTPLPSAQPVRVVVVDNEPTAAAAAAVGQAALPFDLRYVHEPRPGIAAARNAAVVAAQGCYALAFIDDDEWPEPDWLAELVRVRSVTGADVVTGPVIPVFDEPPPDWAVAGRFFERDRFATGSPLHYARTSNVLVSSTLFTTSGLRFDQHGRQGGEDTLFFDRAVRLGHRIVWADAAVVRESVPASRVTGRWLVRRHYRYGLTRSAALRDAAGSPLRYGRRALHGLLLLCAGGVRASVGLLTADPVRRVRGAQSAALGLGLVAGLWGATYDDYDVVHGR